MEKRLSTDTEPADKPRYKLAKFPRTRTATLNIALA